MYLAEKINRRMVRYDAQFEALIGTEVSYRAVRKLVADVVAPWGKVSLVTGKNELKSFFPISGTYNHNQSKKTNRIRVYLHIPEDRDTIIPSRQAIEGLRRRVAQVLQHELIHREQHEHRDAEYIDHDEIKYVQFHTSRPLSKKQTEHIKYLTERDEIDAYAHDIAFEIKSYYPNSAPRDVLRTIGKRRFVDSFKYYRKGFKNLEWANVRQTLLGRVYKWLPQVIPVPPLPNTSVRST